jgi:hypothetical protein
VSEQVEYLDAPPRNLTGKILDLELRGYFAG